MDLVLDVERDLVQTREPDLAEISQKLRRLGRDMRSLSDTQPDFSKRLESLRNELDSVACRLRRANRI
jgi:chromosome segregation ATPase